MIRNLTIIDTHQLNQYSPVVLAYVGDAVYELLARTHVVSAGSRKVKDIHRETVDIVKAESQARVIREIYGELSQEEQDIVRRGRNAKTTPGNRNNDLFEYKLSTGFEALIGYLYLNGDEDRVRSIIERALDILDYGETARGDL